MNLTHTADFLADALKKLGFIILSDTQGRGLPVVAFRIDPARNIPYNEFAIAHQLRERGWVVPTYTMAPNSQQMKMMRIVVREDFTKNRCNALLADFKLALDTLDKMDKDMVQKYTMYAKLISRLMFVSLLTSLSFLGTVEERYLPAVVSLPNPTTKRMIIPSREPLANRMASARYVFSYFKNLKLNPKFNTVFSFPLSNT